MAMIYKIQLVGQIQEYNDTYQVFCHAYLDNRTQPKMRANVLMIFKHNNSDVDYLISIYPRTKFVLLVINKMIQR